MKWLRYVLLTIPVGLRVLRNWPRLEKEGLEALRASLQLAQAARRNQLAGSISATLASLELQQALKELADAVAVIEEILDVRSA